MISLKLSSSKKKQKLAHSAAGLPVKNLHSRILNKVCSKKSVLVFLFQIALLIFFSYFSLETAWALGAWAQSDEKPLFHCVGTEPFWALTISQNEVWLTPLGDSTQHSRGRWLTPSGLLPSYSQHFFGDELVAIIVKQSCHDGMSDRQYPYWVGIQKLGDHQEGYHGCCIPIEE